MWSEIAAAVAPYGWNGLLLLVTVFLVYRLIDRGFTFQVPPKRGNRS